MRRIKDSSDVEIKRLQEKYLNPVEKIGKPRSHIGNLQYGYTRYTQDGQKIDLNSGKLARLAIEIGVEKIEKQIEQEMKLPPEI